MSEKEKIRLVVKAIRCYSSEHYGWAAKYHEEDYNKWLALREFADDLERGINEQNNKFDTRQSSNGR